jgi:hypothetical protein
MIAATTSPTSSGIHPACSAWGSRLRLPPGKEACEFFELGRQHFQRGIGGLASVMVYSRPAQKFEIV